ncbi:MAG: hypothetical protein ABJN96_09300 [Marinomonas sp.]
MGKILAKFPIILSVIGAFSFYASFLFENGYFFGIKYDLIRLLGFTDYIDNAIIWLPLIALPAIAGAYIEFGNKIYAEKIKAEEPANSINSARSWFFANSAFLQVLFCIVLGALLALSSESPLREVAIACISAFMLMIVIRILLSTSDTLNYFTPETRFYITTSVIIVTMSIVLISLAGYAIATKDLSRNTSNLAFASKIDEPVVLLRAINKGYLLKEISSNSVLFLTPDGELIAKYQLKIVDRRSYLCRWFDFKCGSVRPLSSNNLGP